MCPLTAFEADVRNSYPIQNMFFDHVNRTIEQNFHTMSVRNR